MSVWSHRPVLRCCFVVAVIVVVVVVAAALPCCGLECPCQTQTSGGGAGWLLPGMAQALSLHGRSSSAA